MCLMGVKWFIPQLPPKKPLQSAYSNPNIRLYPLAHTYRSSTDIPGFHPPWPMERRTAHCSTGNCCRLETANTPGQPDILRLAHINKLMTRGWSLATLAGRCPAVFPACYGIERIYQKTDAGTAGDGLTFATLSGCSQYVFPRNRYSPLSAYLARQ